MSYLPLFRAAFNISNPSSYSIFQSCQSLLPIPRVPRIGEEIRSPEEPDRTYSTLVAFTLLRTKVETGGASIFLREKISRSKTSLRTDLFPSTASACNKALYNGREIHLQISINLIKDSRCTRPKNQHPLPKDEKSLAEIHISRVSPNRARHGICSADDCAADIDTRSTMSIIGNAHVRMLL